LIHHSSFSLNSVPIIVLGAAAVSCWPGLDGPWALLARAAVAGVVGAWVALTAQVVRGTLKGKPTGTEQNRWGINQQAVRCPKCTGRCPRSAGPTDGTRPSGAAGRAGTAAAAWTNGAGPSKRWAPGDSQAIAPSGASAEAADGKHRRPSTS
jgi:hypothetical protein